MRKFTEYINSHKTLAFFTALTVFCLALGSGLDVGAPEYSYARLAEESAGEGEGGADFISWDADALSAQVPIRAAKPYTIMVYMNGSDLESETAAATFDLGQMLDSGLDSRSASLVVLTGGTNRWQNGLIPENSCMIWEISDGDIQPVADLGMLNMGDPGTLSGFIEFAMCSFPADRYGLVMWDHGGGSIAGYGSDEKFNNATLTLADMGAAFRAAGLAGAGLEFLGFDSCLMSTVEMAVVASEYAKYLIASEDLSPGEGWDYTFLEVLNNRPDIDGGQLGIAICDYFMDYYGEEAEDILNISVVDLSGAGTVMDAMGALMGRCSDSLLADRRASFAALARRRGDTRTFGEGSARDNESDMVDIGDMAAKLRDMYPEEAGAVLSALGGAVIYNRNNSGAELSGLSSYYIYAGRDFGAESLDIYEGLGMDGEYTGYLRRFYDNLVNRGRYRGGSVAGAGRLDSEEILKEELTAWKPAGDGSHYMTGARVREAAGANGLLWPELCGEKICLRKVNGLDGLALYAAPAELNGRDCDIIVAFDEKCPEGKVLGARASDEYVIQKGYDEIEAGDRLSLYYPKRFFDGSGADGWLKGREITVPKPGEGAPGGKLRLGWAQNSDDTRYSVRVTDIMANEHYGGLQEAPRSRGVQN